MLLRIWQTLAAPLVLCKAHLAAHGSNASAHERNWSTYEWVHNRKRNRLVTLRAEKQARSFSNLNVLRRNAMYQSGFIEWDVEMLIEEPDGEPAEPVRSIPPRAARPAPRSLALDVR